MKDSLAKSVQMAIEISTKSIERSAAHEAARMEQEAKGLLERQKLLNEKVCVCTVGRDQVMVVSVDRWFLSEVH